MSSRPQDTIRVNQSAEKCRSHRPKETRHEIRDAAGVLQAIHVRTDFPCEPGRKKDIKFQRPSGEWGLAGRNVETLPLYGAEKLRHFEAGTAIIVTEGEKAAQALMDLGVPAVGTACGAGPTPLDDVLEALVFFVVFLWPDNDDVGRDHMNRIGARLQSLGCQDIRLIAWEDAPDKGDAADAIALDLDVAEIILHATPFQAPLAAARQAEKKARRSRSRPAKEGPALDTSDPLLRRILARCPGLAAPNAQGWMNGPCPIPGQHPHGDEHPSFGINVTLGVYNCFVHGSGSLRTLAHLLDVPLPLAAFAPQVALGIDPHTPDDAVLASILHTYRKFGLPRPYVTDVHRACADALLPTPPGEATGTINALLRKANRREMKTDLCISNGWENPVNAQLHRRPILAQALAIADCHRERGDALYHYELPLEPVAGGHKEGAVFRRLRDRLTDADGHYLSVATPEAGTLHVVSTVALDGAALLADPAGFLEETIPQAHVPRLFGFRGAKVYTASRQWRMPRAKTSQWETVATASRGTEDVLEMVAKDFAKSGVEVTKENGAALHRRSPERITATYHFYDHDAKDEDEAEAKYRARLERWDFFVLEPKTSWVPIGEVA